ncbi:MAG: helix-turn-helix domain-containing protein [Desulfitobacteriaceae bacterium]|nr:helix-turn-helix domain-containing protein [Desulfitobacteriaceae bacterium]
MAKIKTSVSASWGKYKIEIKGVEPYVCIPCDRKVYDLEEAKMIQEIARGYADSGLVEKPEFLNVEEISNLLKVSTQTIYNMLKDGRLSASKVGREWRFNRNEVEKLFAPQAVAARGNTISKNDLDIINSLGIEAD